MSDTTETNANARGSFPCPHCGRIMPFNRSLVRHIKSIHPEHYTPSHWVIRRQEIRARNLAEGGIFACKKCSATFTNRFGLAAHQIKHRDDPAPTGKILPVESSDWWLVEAGITALKASGVPASVVLSALSTIHRMNHDTDKGKTASR